MSLIYIYYFCGWWFGVGWTFTYMIIWWERTCLWLLRYSKERLKLVKTPLVILLLDSIFFKNVSNWFAFGNVGCFSLINVLIIFVGKGSLFNFNGSLLQTNYLLEKYKNKNPVVFFFGNKFKVLFSNNYIFQRKDILSFFFFQIKILFSFLKHSSVIFLLKD